jgi:hypothetical protein
LWVFEKLHLQPRGTVVQAAPAAQPFDPAVLAAFQAAAAAGAQLQSQTTGQDLDAPF